MPPLDQVLEVFLHVMLPPTLLAAVLMVPAGLLAKRWPASAAIGSALSLAAGVLLGGWLRDVFPLTSWPGLPTREWVPWVALAALTTAAIAALPSVPASVGWGLRGLVAGNAGWLLTPVGMRGEFFWAPLLLGAVVLAEWAVLEQLEAGGFMPLAAGASAVAASVILIFAGSALLSDAELILAGSLVGIGVVSIPLRARPSAVSAGVAVILPSLLLSGWYETFSAVPTTSFALAALSPLALAPSLLPAWRRNQKQGLWAVQAILLLAPLMAAVALAAQHESLDYD